MLHDRPSGRPFSFIVGKLVGAGAERTEVISILLRGALNRLPYSSHPRDEWHSAPLYLGGSSRHGKRSTVALRAALGF
jgi:hypothetical protein